MTFSPHPPTPSLGPAVKFEYSFIWTSADKSCPIFLVAIGMCVGAAVSFPESEQYRAFSFGFLSFLSSLIADVVYLCMAHLSASLCSL